MVAITRIIATVVLTFVAANLPGVTASPVLMGVKANFLRKDDMSSMRTPTSINMLALNRNQVPGKEAFQSLKLDSAVEALQPVQKPRGKPDPSSWSMPDKNNQAATSAPTASASTTTNSKQSGPAQPVGLKKRDSVHSTTSTGSLKSSVQQPAGLNR
jgi:hypothetical protein